MDGVGVFIITVFMSWAIICSVSLGKRIGEFQGQKDYANGIIKIHQVTNEYHEVTWERIPNQ